MRVRERVDDARQQELRLARRLAAGDRSALAEAYHAWAGRVHTIVSRLVGHDAPDITHDAFIEAFERAGDFRGSGSLRAWIERIAVTLALRSLRRQRLLHGFVARFRPSAPATPTPAEVAELEAAIRALPDPLRVVFVLHAVEGYPHDDVAAMLDITVAASRQRLRRARAVLAETFDPGSDR